MISSVMNCSSGNKSMYHMKAKWMWTWISDTWKKKYTMSHGSSANFLGSVDIVVKWTNEEKELALLTSLSEELPELHFAPDLAAAAAEKPTSSCSCSRGEFSFPHYLCLTDCSSLYPSLHPSTYSILPPPPSISALTCNSLIPQFICIVFHRSPYKLVRVPL